MDEEKKKAKFGQGQKSLEAFSKGVSGGDTDVVGNIRRGLRSLVGSSAAEASESGERQNEERQNGMRSGYSRRN